MKYIKTQRSTIEILYLVLQYLSNAARCYLPKREDDKHLDMQFSIEENCFVIDLSDDPRCVFSFNFMRFTLEFTIHNTPKIMRLNGSSHKQILKWIRMITKEAGFDKTYKYVSKQKNQFPITDDYVFHIPDIEELDHMMQRRMLAHQALQTTLQDLGIEHPIRVHSFVLSSVVKFAYSEIENIFIELGYAIPDETLAEHYYYLTCYRGNRKIHVAKMNPLRIGYWIDQDIKGAVLPASGFSIKVVTAFFQEALSAFMNKINKR